MDWIDEVVEFAETMTEEQFQDILSVTDLECKKCGTCCVLPNLRFLDKPPGKRCQYLTEDNLCRIHKNKPKPCIEFPHMSQFKWVVKFELGAPRHAIAFCRIIEDFWVKAYAYFMVGGGCFTCQVCDTCQKEMSYENISIH